MMQKVKILLALALFAGASATYADPPARVARLNFISGAVSFAPAEAPGAWTEAVLNRPLSSGDRLWADNDGRAELHLGSTAIRLAPLTSIDVLNLDDETLQVRLAQGAINLRVRDLARDEIVEVATPTGAVLIRQPGSYRFSVDPHGDVSRVRVNFGQAEVITPTQTVSVPSSQSAVVPANAPVAFEVAAYGAADEFDRWSAERDRREDQVTATRYVSRDMTGYEDLDQYGSWRTLPEYGAVWVPTGVAQGWAPFRHGHWVWMSPWGWTWVDDAPWGFAPFHYGRWIRHDSHWAWAPGPRIRRPVYAPALVAFVGGSGFSVSVRSGPAVGWFPLGWREPFIPWYRASHAHVRNVNVTHVTNIHNTTNINHVHRRRLDAVTVVPRQAFVSARPVAQARFRVAQNELASAEVIREKSPAEPIRASVARERPGQRPPAQAAAREVVAVNPPAPQARRDVPALRDRGAGFTRSADAELRVRVLRRDRADRAERASADSSTREQAQQAIAPPGAASAASASQTPARAAPVTVAPQSAPRAAPVTGAPLNSAPAAVPAPSVAAPRPVERRAPPQSATAPRAADVEHPGAAPRQGLGARSDPDAPRRGADEGRREAREQRNLQPPQVVPRPQVAERERGDPRPGAMPRNDAQRDGGLRRERPAERAQQASPPREAQVTRQSFPPPQAATPTPRAPEAAPPREAPRQRQVPPREAQVTRPSFPLPQAVTPAPRARK